MTELLALLLMMNHEAPDTPAPVAEPASATASSRGVVAGSALALPRRTFEVGLRTVAPVGGGLDVRVGLDGKTELDAALGLAFDDRFRKTMAGGVGVKRVLYQGTKVHVAVAGSIHRFRGEQDYDADNAYSAGVLATFVDDEQAFMFTGGAYVLRVAGQDEDGAYGLVPMVTVGMSYGNSTWRGFAELFAADDRDETLIGAVGLRYHAGATAIEAGLLLNVDRGAGSGTLPLLGIVRRM